MAWTSTQKRMAVRSCRAAGICEEQRTDMILRHFQHAHHGGRITSTAPKLSNQDFAAFMAIVEHTAGGKVLHFSQGYWEAAAADLLVYCVTLMPTYPMSAGRVSLSPECPWPLLSR